MASRTKRVVKQQPQETTFYNSFAVVVSLLVLLAPFLTIAHSQISSFPSFTLFGAEPTVSPPVELPLASGYCEVAGKRYSLSYHPSTKLLAPNPKLLDLMAGQEARCHFDLVVKGTLLVFSENKVTINPPKTTGSIEFSSHAPKEFLWQALPQERRSDQQL